ncbi:DUF1127 domain-containing protein [Tropicimonas sp. IMCC6043]|uniref:DUF1127 domain-containing protein n=1 Tax=Tropicimonas sp. IMCC6043 TaxID=2510645 RepID=UPI00101B78D8|nr:DUF1127 domain-containing protein [Tropicimonas sp. IMCC6043]RYH06136.1 DUF1127 domain-containing protein [Tropicimonas sp. IMCC6043]
MTALTQDSFHVQHLHNCRTGAGAAGGRIGRFWTTRKCRSKAARDLRVLRGLSDHQLRDIGLSRSDVGGWDDSLQSSAQKIRVLSGR